jgi:MFS family permease
MYLAPPLVIGVLRLFPHLGPWATITGLLIMCLALGLSSLSTTVPHLIATQGVFYAVGGAIAYCPCILYLDEWFVNRKGLAYGTMWSGTGLAGVILPLLLQRLLSTTGFRTTLRIWTAILFVMTAPLAYFVRPRLPLASATHARPWNFKFLLTKLFLAYQLANVAEAMGFFLPAIYLPTFANQALGANSFLSALTVLLFNTASVFGCVAIGSMTDRFHVTTCILVSTVGATLSVFVLWGLSSSLPTLYAFSVVYGLFAGSFTSTYPGIMKQVADRERRRGGVDPSMVFGCLAAGRGVGNIVSGPVSEALVKGYPWQGEAASGYGSGFGSLIVFTGVTALLGGASYLWRRIGWLKDEG